MGYKVVVVGATGNVGREMLSILSERQFPVENSGFSKQAIIGNRSKFWRSNDHYKGS